MSFRNDVIDVERRDLEYGWFQAVFAAVFGALAHLLADGSSNTGHETFNEA